jgi:hypothetical protein
MRSVATGGWLSDRTQLGNATKLRAEIYSVTGAMLTNQAFFLNPCCRFRHAACQVRLFAWQVPLE